MEEETSRKLEEEFAKESSCLQGVLDDVYQSRSVLKNSQLPFRGQVQCMAQSGHVPSRKNAVQILQMPATLSLKMMKSEMLCLALQITAKLMSQRSCVNGLRS